jgi:hypothetical protein
MTISEPSLTTTLKRGSLHGKHIAAAQTLLENEQEALLIRGIGLLQLTTKNDWLTALHGCT